MVLSILTFGSVDILRLNKFLRTVSLKKYMPSLMKLLIYRSGGKALKCNLLLTYINEKIDLNKHI